MSDHWHYSSDIHGGAEEYHRHYDLEREDQSLMSYINGLREDLTMLTERVRKLEADGIR